MITGLIAGVFLLVGVPMAISEQQWGVLAVVIIVALILLGLGAAGRSVDRAYVNRVNYWAMSGKERARAERRWDAEARAEEARERRAREEREAIREARRRPRKAELEEAARKREAYIASVQERSVRRNADRSQTGPLRVCHACGRMVRAEGGKVFTEHGHMTSYVCPVCGAVNVTKLGA